MSEELWYVKLANGDVHRVTLDQLDGAFQAGHIDENTMVLAAGASTWTKLGELAGLEDEGEQESESESQGESESQSAEAGSDESSGSWDIPVHLANAPVEYVAPRQPQTLPTVVVAPEPPAVTTPERAQPAAAQLACTQLSSTPPAYVQPVAAPRSYAPPAAMVPVAPAHAVSSLRPTSVDLGDLEADVQYPRKSRKGFVFVALGLAAIAGGVGLVTQKAHLGLGDGGGSDDLSRVAAAAAMAPPPPVQPIADPTPPAPPPAAPSTLSGTSPSTASAPTEGSPLNPMFTNRLNEDTKLKLLSADKMREAKAKARHGGGGPHVSSKPSSKPTNFTTGGNKFDPLNSSI